MFTFLSAILFEFRAFSNDQEIWEQVLYTAPAILEKPFSGYFFQDGGQEEETEERKESPCVR